MTRRTNKHDAAGATPDGVAGTLKKPSARTPVGKKAAAKKTLVAAMIQEIKPPAAASSGASAAASVDTHEAIARRAFEIYRGRCERGEEGCAEGDWQQAEREVWASIGER